jgi:hypothetical protein
MDEPKPAMTSVSITPSAPVFFSDTPSFAASMRPQRHHQHLPSSTL